MASTGELSSIPKMDGGLSYCSLDWLLDNACKTQQEDDVMIGTFRFESDTKTFVFSSENENSVVWSKDAVFGWQVPVDKVRKFLAKREAEREMML